MTGAVLLFLAIALGHLCLTIYVMNSLHGVGFNARWMDNLVFVGLAVVGLTFLAGAWAVWGRHPWDWPLPNRAYAVACLATLFVGLPGATLARHLRKPPVEAKTVSTTLDDLSRRCDPEALIGPGKAGRLLRLPGNESLTIRRTEWDVTLDTLPASLDGLSILHLTDLHFSHSYRRFFFEEVADLAMADAPMPDLVVITGDFLDDDDAVSWVGPVLGRFQARLGKIAILGNHDYRHDFRGLRRELRRADFTTLEGRWATINADGASLVIGGTSYPWGRDLDPSLKPDGDVSLLLSHAPDQVYRASSWGMDLMLCGHNHGGQVRLPVLGPILMPSRYSRRFDRGFYRVGKTLMYVGHGIGGKHPVRFGCEPELTRFRLRSHIPDPLFSQGMERRLADIGVAAT